MKWGRIPLIFFLSFSLEVKVKASGDASACLFEINCAERLSKRTEFKGSRGESFVFSKGGAYFTAEQKRVMTLMEGEFLAMDLKSPWKIKTLHGEIEIEKGDFFLKKNGKSEFELYNLNASVNVTLRDGRALELPLGFKVWIGPVSADSQNQAGIVEPLELSEVTQSLRSVYLAASQKSVAQRFLSWKDAWGDSVARASDLYQKSVDRTIAAAEERQQQLEAEKEQQRKQKEAARALFHQRAFER